ncbi:MAG TPA: agmatine deiminase family protein [Phnomibacter sp.]|nr:agmatine deiminase family protein [Phnomibacter sp.]
MRPAIFIIFLALLGCNTNTPNGAAFYMPGEFEPQQAVWFGWEDRDLGFYKPIAEIIEAIRNDVQVKIAVDSDSLLQVCKRSLSSNGVDTTGLLFYVMPGERYWIRDHGAAFLVNKKGELAAADFVWSLYGFEAWYKQYYNGNMDSVNKRMEAILDKHTGSVDSLMAVAEKAAIIKSDIVIEGGAIEVNGKGTLIQCEDVTLQRNPNKTKQELEDGLKAALGVKHIIWVKQGLIEDAHLRQLHQGRYLTFGTGGHVDEFVRFADERTVLLAWVDDSEVGAHPLNAINAERMRENLRILESAADQDGKKLNIIKVPLPDPITRQVVVNEKYDPANPFNVTPNNFLPDQRPHVGDTLQRIAASSYLNYLVTNNWVVLPTYVAHGSSAEKEKQVASIFEKAFPGRKLLWVDVMPQNWSGGGIHCSTQQQPKVP